MARPQLSVVIACRNAAETLAQQLEALRLEPRDDSWELIICDNGSADGSADIVRDYQTRMPNLRYLEASERRGAAYARNRGVDAANADFIAFCDADDEVQPGWVVHMMQALRHHQVVAGQILFDKFNAPAEAGKRQRGRMQGLSHRRFLPHAVTANMGIHRALHQAIGGFDERLLRAEDIDYSWRLICRGVRIEVASRAKVQYRMHNRMLEAQWTLAELYSHHRGQGQSHEVLYKKFRRLGMRRMRGVASVGSSWAGLVWGIPRACRSKDSLRLWIRRLMREFGYAVGFVQGVLSPYQRVSTEPFTEHPAAEPSSPSRVPEAVNQASSLFTGHDRQEPANSDRFSDSKNISS